MTENLDFEPLPNAVAPRHDWTRDEVNALFAQPFNDLIFEAQSVHRQWFDANAVQKKARYCLSKPAAAPKTAIIAVKARSLKPASKPPS